MAVATDAMNAMRQFTSEFTLSLMEAAQIWSVSERTAHSWVKSWLKSEKRPKDSGDERRLALPLSQVREIAERHKRAIPTDGEIVGIVETSRQAKHSLEALQSLMSSKELASMIEVVASAMVAKQLKAIEPDLIRLSAAMDKMQKQITVHTEKIGAIEEEQSRLSRMVDAIRIVLGRLLGVPLSERMGWAYESLAETLGVQLTKLTHALEGFTAMFEVVAGSLDSEVAEMHQIDKKLSKTPRLRGAHLRLGQPRSNR